MTSDDALAEGLHEAVVTTRLLERLAQRADLTAHLAKVDLADQPHVLARHLGTAVLRALRATPSTDVGARVRLAQDILDLLDATDEGPVDGVRELLALTRPPRPGRPATYPQGVRPATPLSEIALLTNVPGEPSLGSELRAELQTCDQVDLVCAFVMWHGMRVLERELAGLRARGVPFRIITTTYIGGTEAKALDRLAGEFGAEIRVQYDPRRTRLHAKGWLFRRNTGFHTAYVGSSNLTHSALLEGAEWNVRLSRIATPTLLDKFVATFDGYWDSPEYASYDPESEIDRARLADALAAAKGGARPAPGTISGLRVTPYPHQRIILESLTAEREVHGRHRNLVVAATGTGKTVVAALDYRDLARRAGELPSLLFVAHRKEILDQSLRTYREVLADGSFGELYVAGRRPEGWRRVFASIQSLTSYGIDRIPPKAFDVVVIDEFHHAEAATYRRLLDRLRPRELLGLTATPERGDGGDVRDHFGGRTAAELRVWDAINADLLTPFHYFGIADTVDLSRVGWSRGRYDEAGLDRLYTGNDARAGLVLAQVADKVSEPTAMRALGFCVGVAHARYMARVFAEAGLAARAVTGATPPTERAQAVADLRAGRVTTLFTADLFNEGVDIPEVDTILFLRPTESPTLFLQQLGRGLRLAGGKAVLTVLDFVGHHRKEFRVDLRFRALTGATRRGLVRDVEKGFPFLPSGCQIVLDKVAQQRVLDNVKANLALTWPRLTAELKAHPTDRLAAFLDESGVDLASVLRGNKSWTTLRRDAGLLPPQTSPLEAHLVKRVRALAHVDDASRATAYQRLLGDDAPAYRDLSPAEQRLARMLFFSLWPDAGGHVGYAEGLNALRPEVPARDEIHQVIDVCFDASRHVTRRGDGVLAQIPLAVHGRFTREEILAALDYAHLDRKPAHFQSGVLFTRVAGEPVDAFLVTLRKSEADYSPTTLYRDYPVNATRFHWESQSTTSTDSPTGRRYLSGASTVLLFVRQQRSDDLGTAPYTFLGRARYARHEGSRPIAITWDLDVPMPADLYADNAVAL